MSENAWDRIWTRASAEGLWSLPDPDVEALIPRLREEGATRVLDLGCGMGRHTVLLAAAGFETFAADSSEQGVTRYRAWLDAEGLEATVTLSPMSRIDYPDGFFDFVVSWNVVYHAVRADLAATLAELHRVLRPNGLLYLMLNSTRNRRFAVGTELEPGTFDDPARGQGHHLHHYSDRADVDDLLSAWRVEKIEEAEEWLGGKVHSETWHWFVLARNV